MLNSISRMSIEVEEANKNYFNWINKKIIKIQKILALCWKILKQLSFWNLVQ